MPTLTNPYPGHVPPRPMPLPPATQAQQAKPEQRNQTRCHRLLQWAAEDLADPVISADPKRLELERQTVIKRLSPHIEEIVQLAWEQLQQVQRSESSRSSP